MRNREGLAAEIEAVTGARPRAHWLALLDAAGVPCGPILDYAEVFADPQVRERGVLGELGCTGDEIRELAASGVVALADGR